MPIEQVSIQIQDALGRFHTFEQSIEIAEPDILAFFSANGFTPELVADFQQESGSELYSAVGGATDFDTMFPSFARASEATYVDSSGTLQTSASGVPRRNHHVWDGTAWVNKGLRYETEARTNLLLNSGTLSTQNVTVTNAAHTIHFTGTGTITLSGASTAGPLVGTGTSEGNRVSLTFTPTAGTLTVTVSGTVTNAQLEVGATPSSYIPTAGATATRAAESGLTIPSALMPWNPDGVSIAVEGLMTYADTDSIASVQYFAWQADTANRIVWNQDTRGGLNNTLFEQAESISGTDRSTAAGVNSPGVNVSFSLASRHTPSLINGAFEGTALTANTTPTALADLSATDFDLAPNFMGTIGKLLVWPDDIADAGIEQASS